MLPNPANPNAQGDPDQNQDQGQDQGQVLQVRSQLLCLHNQYHNRSQHNQLLLVSYLFLKLFIKIG